MSKRIKRTCIYVLISPDRKFYVGQTTDWMNRKSRYKTSTCLNQRLVMDSLRKFGFDNHKLKVVLFFEDGATQQQLDFYEIFYHSLYLQCGYESLNLKSPGKNGIPAIESRLLKSKNSKGQKPWNTGTKGVCKAWNKGVHSPRLTYKVKKDGQLIEIGDLKVYCSEKGISYSTMLTFLKGKRGYKNLSKYKEYERI